MAGVWGVQVRNLYVTFQHAPEGLACASLRYSYNVLYCSHDSMCRTVTLGVARQQSWCRWGMAVCVRGCGACRGALLGFVPACHLLREYGSCCLACGARVFGFADTIAVGHDAA